MPANSEDKKVNYTLMGTSSGKTGKLEIFSDETWRLALSYYEGGAFNPLASGSWKLRQVDSALLLTVTDDPAQALDKKEYEAAADTSAPPAIHYSLTMVCTIPQVGTIELKLTTKPLAAEHFTVAFDLNYPSAPELETKTTKTFVADNGATKEYLDAAPSAPERAGYKFAGWHTVKNPTLTNGASTSEYLFGKKASAYNANPLIKDDVMALASDTTLYARWVEVTEIATEEQLQDMANDLAGWYRLTADIALSQAWTPVGMYYANYEFYEPNWWLYSFRGTLEGNSHQISGLRLETLTFGANAITEAEGSADGTTALFAAAVNCTVKDLTIEGARVAIANYEANTHAYVSVLAAFVQGGNTRFENCLVRGATIEVSTKNVWYVSVAGLFGGHWGGSAKNCAVTNSSLTLNTAFDKILEGYPYEAVYLGALVGEGYAWMKNCQAAADIHYSLNDSRAITGKNVPLDIYLGEAMGSSTYAQGLIYEGALSFDYAKEAGGSNVYLGGLVGLQRYGFINNSVSKAAMAYTAANLSPSEGQSLSCGGILGANDTLYGLMGYAYYGLSDGCRVNNCLDLSTLTKGGAAVADLPTIGKYALYAAEVKGYADALGADVSSFVNADGFTSNFFGAFHCVRLRSTAAPADANGTITVSEQSELLGDALQATLGAGWSYEEGRLPRPKPVA